MAVPLVPGLAGEGPGQAGRAGRCRKLSEGQLAQVEAALGAGPKANGFPTEMWTLARVARVIERVTGTRYSQAQTWVVLRERLGWTCQCPARRAVERNKGAIAGVGRPPAAGHDGAFHHGAFHEGVPSGARAS
jgi:transposase